MFEATHEKLLALVREGLVDGLRVDHPGRPGRPGGLPRAAARRRAPSGCGWRRSSTPASRCATGRCPGTVGYEFLNDVCALFVDPAGEAALTALWERVSGDARPFGECGARGQARAGDRGVPAGDRAARRALRARTTRSERRWPTRRLSSLPVYRTYVEP